MRREPPESIRAQVEHTIADFRVRAKLPPLDAAKRYKAQHPYPRRDPRRDEIVSMEGVNAVFKPSKAGSDEQEVAVDGHERHRAEYVNGCVGCYNREYRYFQRHPRLRPKHRKTAGADEQGRPAGSQPYKTGWKPNKFPWRA